MSTFFMPRAQIVDLAGRPYAGAKVSFFAAGTSTPLTVYSDVGLTIPISQPAVADAAGIFPAIFTPPGLYKVTITDSSNVQIWSQDNVDPAVSTSLGAVPIAQGGTGATTAATALANLGAASAATLTATQLDIATNYYSKVVNPIATQAEAIAGTANDRLMTPLAVAEVLKGGVISSAYVDTNASILCSAMSAANVDPTVSQGTQICAINYTAIAGVNKLKLSATVTGQQTTGSSLFKGMLALFADSTLLSAWVVDYSGNGGGVLTNTIELQISAVDATVHTYSLRAGAVAANNALTVNSSAGPPSQKSSLTILEIKG